MEHFISIHLNFSSTLIPQEESHISTLIVEAACLGPEVAEEIHAAEFDADLAVAEDYIGLIVSDRWSLDPLVGLIVSEVEDEAFGIIAFGFQLFATEATYYCSIF